MISRRFRFEAIMINNLVYVVGGLNYIEKNDGSNF